MTVYQGTRNPIIPEGSFGELFLYGGRRPPMTGVAEPAPTAFAPNWWDTAGPGDTPGISWGNTPGYARPMGTEGPYTEMIIPEWAAGEFQDPRTFYDVYQGLPEDLRPGFTAGLQSAHNARLNNEAARAAALETLTGATDRTTGMMEEFRADPYRSTVLQGLQERAEDPTPAFTAVEEAAMNLKLAQNYARGKSGVEARAAGRGTGAGGATGGTLASLRTGADASGLQLGAQVDAANAAMRAQVLESLGRTSGMYGNMDRAYAGELDRLAALKAAMEADVNYVPTDMMRFSELGAERDRYEDEVAREQAALAAYEKSMETDLYDWLDLAVRAMGSGLFEGALGLVGGGGGGDKKWYEDMGMGVYD